MGTEVIALTGTAIFLLGVSILSITGLCKYISLIIEAFKDKSWVEVGVLIGSLLTLLGLIFIFI